ncbi:helix-turn-helix domain-containing protein [Pedobacter suwonensis]|uniref:helix-turn-helix domain-containing protein n=1 Tax=Pedobacter suwonensis TaxID=332999 RepID=UPI00368E3C05
MDSIKNIKSIECSEVTQNELKFAVYHTSDFLPFMQRLSVPHRHRYFMVLLNEFNSGTQLIDFRDCRIEPLSVTCMYAGQIHQWLDYENLDGYIIVFETSFLDFHHHASKMSEYSFFSYRQSLPYIRVEEGKFLEWKTIIQWMLRAYTDKPVAFEKSILYLLHLLFTDLNRYFEPSGSGGQLGQSIQLVHHYEQLVDKFYHQKHFVKDYSSMLYVRPNYLNSVCNEVTGLSASELIRNRIILEAKRLLINDQKNIAEIAYHLGFEDNSYFGKFFKKHEGMTPDGFKRQYHKK